MRFAPTRETGDPLEPLYTHLIHGTAARVRGDRAGLAVASVERVLSLPADAMRRHRLEAVRSLLAHARDTVPWYRERMAAQGFLPAAMTSLEELRSLPPLTRQHLSGQPDRLLSSAHRGRGLVEARSGGTTSAAVPFLQPRDAVAWKDAAALALKRRMGWRPGHRTALLWGAAQDAPPSPTDPARRWKAFVERRVVQRTLYLPAGDLPDERLDDYADRLRRFGPHVLQGYPSAVDLLARRLLQRGERLRVPIVLLTAEPVLPEQRARVGQALEAQVFTFYGARECGWIASECAAEHRLHLNTAGVHVEREADGRLLVTDLVNRAMPLIRYEIGDRGRLDPDPCPCGDPRPVLAGLEGRVNDVFTLPSGRRVPGVLVDLRAYRIGLGVLEAQLVQEDLSHLDVNWVAGPKYRPGDEEEMRRHFDLLFFGELTIRLNRVDRLPVAPNGKLRYCISKVGASDR